MIETYSRTRLAAKQEALGVLERVGPDGDREPATPAVSRLPRSLIMFPAAMAPRTTGWQK